MRRLLGFILLIAATAVSCGGNKTADAVSDAADSVIVADSVVADNTPSGLENISCNYDRTDKFCTVTASVECPKGNGAVPMAIRQDLLNEMDKCMALDGEKRHFARYNNAPLSIGQVTKYYVDNTFKYLRLQSEEEHKLRVEMAREYAESDKRKFEEPEVNQYSKMLKIRSERITDTYCVYNLLVYCYYGGAHGSTFSTQYTYNLADGKRFTNFLKPGAAKALQPIIRQGLVEYFSKDNADVNQTTLFEYLQVEGNRIPLPAEPAFPAADGMVFTYGQYEIAPYAAGCPSFTVPYGKLKPYLTQEAITLFGL